MNRIFETAAVASLILVGVAGAYEPLMPKNGPTTKVLVIEASKNKAEAISLSCLQGLVNRDSREKIYVKNWTTRIFSHPELSEYARGGGMGDVYEMMLEMIPYPKERVKLPGGRHAALKWLLDKHHDKVKGLVLVSERSDGSAAAGINACTFESLLPVTGYVRDAIRSWGYEFEIKHDVSGMSNIEATRWSIGRYMKDPRRVKHIANYSDPQHLMNDYMVSNFIFSYRLEGKKEGEPEILDELLAPGNFAPSVMHIGGAEGPKLIPHLASRGSYCVCGHVGNCSVTSSIPTRPGEFPRMRQGKALPASPDTAFICFSGNDGDAIDFGLYCATKNLHNDPHAGKVPMAWKVNPIFIDLFPTWYRSHLGRHDNVEIAGSFNDGGCPTAKLLSDDRREAAISEWESQYARLISGSGGSMRQFCVLGPYCAGKSRTVRFLRKQGADFVFRGYDSKGFEGITRMALVDGKTVVSNLVGLAPNGPEATCREIRRSLTEFDRPGRPMFIMVRLGVTYVENNDETAARSLLDPAVQSATKQPGKDLYVNARRGILPFTMARSIMNLLDGDDSIRRKIRYVNPRDFAATYRKWALKNRIPSDSRQPNQPVK